MALALAFAWRSIRVYCLLVYQQVEGAPRDERPLHVDILNGSTNVFDVEFVDGQRVRTERNVPENMSLRMRYPSTGTDGPETSVDVNLIELLQSQFAPIMWSNFRFVREALKYMSAECESGSVPPTIFATHQRLGDAWREEVVQLVCDFARRHKGCRPNSQQIIPEQPMLPSLSVVSGT